MPGNTKGPRLLEQSGAKHQEGAANQAPSILHIIQSIVNILLAVEVGLVCAMAVALWALPTAWAERGYMGGIGGEWLLILLAGAAGGWLTAQVLKILEGGDGTC